MASDRTVCIWLDFDDTLAPNAGEYTRVSRNFCRWLYDRTRRAMPLKTIAQILQEKDLAAVSAKGFDRTRYPGAMVSTYFEVYRRLMAEGTGGRPSPDEEELDVLHIYELGNSVFNRPPIPYADAEDTLRTFHEAGYTVGVITLGDRVTQRYKLAESGLDDLLPYQYIVERKDVSVYRARRREFPGAISIMIGNSVTSDINPAVEAGMYAIHIARESWTYDKSPLAESDRIYHASCLAETPAIIAEIIAREGGEAQSKSRSA